jgi:hypothetical protein
LQKHVFEFPWGSHRVGDFLEVTAFAVGFTEAGSQFLFLSLLSRRFRRELAAMLGLRDKGEGRIDVKPVLVAIASGEVSEWLVF